MRSIESKQEEAYDLTDSDLAVVIVARHGTTPFAFNEAIWTKYGAIFAENMSTNNKTLHPNPTTNRFARQLENHAKGGLRLAVCNLTTRAYTDIIAKQTGKPAADIREELTSNTLANAVMVPAGIIAFAAHEWPPRAATRSIVGLLTNDRSWNRSPHASGVTSR